MDPQSLDAAVQNTLSGLYPPFDITAPTVLSQLFRVLEAGYRGDGLCCLLDFLIPSKRLLEHVRQAACAPYFSRVFLHEGWPLCLHERVVVHLGPLNPLLLRPGDFYLQAEPCGEQSACLVMKCLSKDLTTVERIPVPEASCSLLFTKEWLEEINRDLDRPTLHTCLVATGNGIVPVSWSKIATPEFVRIPPTDGAVEQESAGCPESHRTSDALGREGSVAEEDLHSSVGRGLRSSPGKYPGLIKVEQGSWKKSMLFVVPSLCDIISENLEGEYVNLVDFSEERQRDISSSATSAPPAGQESRKEVSPQTKNGLVWVNADMATTESWICGKGQNSEEGPCTPCLRRKLSQDPTFHEPRCRYRESYVAALKNPVSFSSGLMAAILEEIDLSKRASPSERTGVKTPEKSDQATPRILSDHPNKEGKAEEGSKQGLLRLLKSPAESPAAAAAAAAAGNKFSFLKGHRQLVSSGGDFAVPEKASKGHEGPRKRTSLVCSPRVARAKPAAGKGTRPADVVLSDPPTLESTEDVAVNASATDTLLSESLPPGSGAQELDLWELLSPDLLASGVVCLPGNTDKLGRPIIQISTGSRAWHAPWCSAKEVTQLLLYLCSLPRKQSNDSGLTVIIDARKERPPPTLPAALGAVQKASPGAIHAVLLLAEKEAASHLEKLPGLQVELLSNLKALSRHVDPSQWAQTLDGPFPYCHSEWVHFFQKMHLFVSDLKKASQVLRGTTQELEKGDLPETLQEAAQQMDRHRQLMQDALCDVQLVSLQREGGATLARLRKEAARLSFCPDVRRSIDGTLALYSRVEEEVHTLVTKSNSRLEHLEFLLKIRELQAEFNKVFGGQKTHGGGSGRMGGTFSAFPRKMHPQKHHVKAGVWQSKYHPQLAELSWWFDKEGESQLSEVGSAESSRESTEESYRRFKEFFKESTVHYSQGLSLAKEAAKLQGSRFPEMGGFEAAKGAFQAKLTVFYMDLETKGAELETLLDLYQFRDKVAQLNLACQQRLTPWRAGENGPQSAELLQEVQNSLQVLSEEFSAEQFQQMKVQASSMRNKRGLAVWGEALEACQEARRILEDTLAKYKEAWERDAKDCAEEGEPFGSDPHPAHTVPDDEGLCLDGALAKTEKEEALSEHSRRKEGGGSVGGTGFFAVPSQEGRWWSTGKGAEEGEGSSASLEAALPHGAPETLHTPALAAPAVLPTHPSCPTADPEPGARETPPCTSLPVRGHRGRKKEAAQYFQLSRQGSFSSEDSQNSTEDARSCSATLPVDSPGPSAAWGPDKPPEIVYLENHSSINRTAAAATALSDQ